jgi:hypothetical protein
MQTRQVLRDARGLPVDADAATLDQIQVRLGFAGGEEHLVAYNADRRIGKALVRRRAVAGNED